MKKIYILSVLLLEITFSAYPQGNVGIGTNTPSSSAKLDIDVSSDATKSGLLIPRVALTSTTDATTIPTPATSLLVYNTAPAGSAPNNVTPGYYYNAGTSASPNWVRMITKADNGWTVANTANTPAGKTDNQYVTGKVGIGDYSATNPTMQLEVKSATTNTDETAILGQSTGTTGKVYGVLGTTASTTTNASGIKGIATGSTGNTNGVWGQSNSTTGSGVYGYSQTHWGVNGESSTGEAVIGIANGNGGIGVRGSSTGTSGTKYAGYFAVENAGTNYGGLFSATGGTNNYGLVVSAGDVGIGTTTPIDKFELKNSANKSVLLGGGANTGSELKLTNSGTNHFSLYNKGDNKLTIANTSADAKTNTAGTELMSVANNGDVKVNNLSGGAPNSSVIADNAGILRPISRTGTYSQAFTTVGSSTYAVPSGVYMIYVELMGAGGGSAHYGVGSNCGTGAGGGFVSGMLPVTPGENLTVVVGAGGAGGATSGTTIQRSGKGGGGSAIYRGGTGGTLLCGAGGGAGGSYNGDAYYGLGGGSAGFTNIAADLKGNDGAGASTNAAGGKNCVDYLLNPISLTGNCDYRRNGDYQDPGAIPSGVISVGNTSLGRSGRGACSGDGGQSGAVLIFR